MLHANPKFHITLQVICFFVAFFGFFTLIVDLFIGVVLIVGAIAIFALDWFYLASDNDE